MLQSAHMGPLISLPPPGAEWKAAGGREGADEERLCARRDFPLALRAFAYKRQSDWLPLRPCCLVRYRPGSGRSRLPSGSAILEEEAGGIPWLSRAFPQLLWARMGVLLKGRERENCRLRSSPLTRMDI